MSLVACMAAAAGVVLAGNWVGEVQPARIAALSDAAHPAAGSTAEAPVADGGGGTAARPNYRYSVIPRGTYTPGALVSAIARDPVVAREYAQVSLVDLRAEVVSAPRMAYMSYRIGDEIYWTKEKVPLFAGESVLTDGVTEIRGRCGNAISDTPGRTFEAEPEEREFALLVADNTDEPEPPVLLAAAAAGDGGVSTPMPVSDAPVRAGRSLGHAVIPAILGASFWALKSSGRCTPRTR